MCQCCCAVGYTLPPAVLIPKHYRSEEDLEVEQAAGASILNRGLVTSQEASIRTESWVRHNPRGNIRDFMERKTQYGGGAGGGSCVGTIGGGRREPSNNFAQILQTATQRRLKCGPIREVSVVYRVRMLVM